MSSTAPISSRAAKGLFNLIKGAPVSLKYEPGVIVADGDYVMLHGRFSGIGQPVNWVLALLACASGRRPSARTSVTDFSRNCVGNIKSIDIGHLAPTRLVKNNTSVLMQALLDALPKDKPPVGNEWEAFINPAQLRGLLNTTVTEHYTKAYREQCLQLHGDTYNLNNLVYDQIQKAEDELVSKFTQQVNDESAMAGALLGMLGQKLFTQLESLFYQKPGTELANNQIAELLNADDPFATFDPKRDIKNVSLSPLGIVHLFRQFFYELDTFLGTPTGHVWLSPGSSVELVEISTRRVYTEKVIEQSTETTQKTERSTTDHDEISEAVKQDNKSDLKLGASLTVNQSWGTGNATATASLNMDTTQDTARESTHKRMREQTEKLSSEIKQNYKSTFKTITETTDTSSKGATDEKGFDRVTVEALDANLLVPSTLHDACDANRYGRSC